MEKKPAPQGGTLPAAGAAKFPGKKPMILTSPAISVIIKNKRQVPPMKRYIAALDQGTTSSRCILFDREQNIIGSAQRELTQIYPRPGWVEQDPMEIWSTQYSVLTEVLAQTGVAPEELAAIGITNQRETTIVLDKNTGRPICNAIVWQCRRTAALCEELKADAAFSQYVQEHTGLLIDAYFSATKLKWILDHVEGAREKAERGDLLFGTVDSWQIGRASCRERV